MIHCKNTQGEGGFKMQGLKLHKRHNLLLLLSRLACLSHIINESLSHSSHSKQQKKIETKHISVKSWPGLIFLHISDEPKRQHCKGKTTKAKPWTALNKSPKNYTFVEMSLDTGRGVAVSRYRWKLLVHKH